MDFLEGIVIFKYRIIFEGRSLNFEVMRIFFFIILFMLL